MTIEQIEMMRATIEDTRYYVVDSMESYFRAVADSEAILLDVQDLCDHKYSDGSDYVRAIDNRCSICFKAMGESNG